MTIGTALLIVAIILMVLGSVPLPSRVNLWQLGWAFVILAVLFGWTGGYVIH
jgi:hypothetical protein